MMTMGWGLWLPIGPPWPTIQNEVVHASSEIFIQEPMSSGPELFTYTGKLC